ncbi:YfhO family protein [Ekhidna sp. MALMAid0563]|uniref:YfhO family protein n=1 Tax=Ekhidna sp. MALMAid0563 TaxID=3143937 RepID=UPI0032DFF5C3
MNADLKKNILTHGLIILGFLLVTLLVHYPSLLGDRQLNQHDILQAQGGNNQIKQFDTTTGEQPLWNPYVFSGMPAYLTGVQYSGDILKYVYKGMMLGMGHPEGILFVSFVTFYILLLSFKVRPLIAAAGALAFGLNGFNMIGIMAGHNAKIAAVAFMPLVLAGIHLTFSGKRWLGFGLTAFALGLQIRTNHPQITYYLAIIVAAYGINVLVNAIREKDFKPFGINAALMLLAAILAVSANYGRLATTMEYSKYTIRGKSELKSDQQASSGLDKEYAFRYSNGIAEPLFLFVPNIFGGSSQQELSTKSAVADALRNAGYNRSQIAQQVQSIPTYWGDQPLTAPYYAGTFTVLLFIFGILVLPKKQKVWLITLAVLGIMMSWGKNFEGFNNFLFDYLPGYNKFRSVTFTIIITIFAMNLLGFTALEKLMSAEWTPELKKKIFMLFGIGGGFLVVLLLFSGALGYRGAIDSQLPDWFLNAIREDRQSLLVRDTLRALMFVVSLAILIWALIKKKVKVNQVILGLLVIVFVDSFSLTKRFLGEEKFVKDPSREFFAMTEADKAITSQASYGERVLNLQNPFNENRTSYYHESIGGYHGAKIRRYQDLIDYCLQSELQSAYQSLQNQSLDFSDLQALNMLNTRFLYAGTQQNAVFPNRYANGNAWIVSEVIPVGSPEEEIGKVCSINTKSQALIDQSKFDIPQISGSGTILLTSKTPNKVTYQANISGGTALSVFSEIYYQAGWEAMIDGEKVDILRANYVLRALEIPSGKHEIVFEFKPKTYYTGNRVMMAGSILVLLIFIGSIFYSVNLKSHKDQ